MNILKTIGSGSESVYVYYHENDAKLAVFESRTTWECKIGYTVRSAIERIAEQTKTGRSSVPIIALIIKTENASLLESSLHRALYEHRIPSTDYTGDEWFITNPEIIEEIYSTGFSPEKTLRSEVEFIINSQADLGARLKQIRHSLKLTQEKLKHINRNVVYRIESGENIETSNLFKLLHNLDYSLALIPRK